MTDLHLCLQSPNLLSTQQQVTSAEPLPLSGLTQHPADLDELGLVCQPGKVVDRPPVSRRHRVVERRHRPALGLEEGE